MQRADFQMNSEKWRVCIFLEDMSYQDIAHELDVTLGTVRSRLHRVRSLSQRALWDVTVASGIISAREYLQSAMHHGRIIQHISCALRFLRGKGLLCVVVYYGSHVRRPEHPVLRDSYGADRV